MRRTIGLDGADWTIQGILGLDAALASARRPGHAGDAHLLPARVPGSVLDDLWRAGEVPNPYVGRNSLLCEWVPERAWVYRRSLDVPRLRDGQRALLRFDGLDHAGHVSIDGQPLARHEGMFVPFEVDVSSALAGGGAHALAVVVEPAPASEPQAGRTSRVRVHKSRMTYGWDFCPRLIHQGLWQSVRLDIVETVRIRDVWARPKLRPDLRRATVAVRAEIDATDAAAVRVQAILDGPSAASASVETTVPGGSSEVLLELRVDNPVLWWPNGHGDPAVHRLTVRLLGEGAALDERTVPLGFRHVQLVPNAGAPADARPYTWVVNGRRIYAKGWNWVPIDALYGVPRPERLAHLLRLAAAANVNLLRVWGGGLIETPAFYEHCDRLGLMVWQEFAQSSSLSESTPSDDPAFVDLLRREARAIVPLRRNHPSLVAWCGGNELEDEHGPLDERSPVLAALRDVVRRLDPDRAWLPTSPSGPRFHNRLDVIESDPDGLHDVHGPWEHQGLREQYRLYDRGTSLLNSEFGVEGMANRRSHEALISREHRWPPTRSNPVYRHLGDFWNNESAVQAAFGSRLRDLEALRRASQWLQAEGLRYAVEANRRRWPRNSGSIPWQLNESYPNAWCTAAVDHRGDPKPAYHAIRRAYAPVVVCASFDRAAWADRGPFEATVWAWSDLEVLRHVDVRARLLALDGRVLGESAFTIERLDERASGAAMRGADQPLPDLFLLDLRLACGDARATNRYLLSGGMDFGAVLDVPTATVAVELAGDCLRVAHRGGPAALGVVVEDGRPFETTGWLELADNGFDLLPDEVREIPFHWSDAPDEGRRLTVTGWNVAPIAVEANP